MLTLGWGDKERDFGTKSVIHSDTVLIMLTMMMLTQMLMLRVLTWVKMLGGHMTNTIAQKIFWLKLTLCFIGLSLGVGICLGEKIFPAI